jgi:hypothetical protein
MRHRLGLIAAAGVSCLLFNPAANGTPVTFSPLPDLVRQADAICVGTAASSKQIGPGWFYVGAVDDQGEKIYIQLQQAATDFHVEDVIKGGAKKAQIDVTFPLNILVGQDIVSQPAGFLTMQDVNPHLFTELVPKERVIVFLKSGTGQLPLALLEPESLPSPKIRIGQAVIQGKPEGLTPLRTILLYMAAALGGKDRIVQIDCLRRIADISAILYQPSQEEAEVREAIQELPTGWLKEQKLYVPYQPAPGRFWIDQPAAKVRHAFLDLPDSLEKFVADSVVPAVLILCKSPDPQVHRQALMTAAALGCPGVIPELAKDYETYLSKKHDELTNPNLGWHARIEAYAVPEAIPYLVPLLQSTYPAVRQAAVHSLSRIDEEQALPFLIDHLEDPDAAVQEQICIALSVITLEVGPSPPFDGQGEKRKRTVAFWHQWANEHKEQLHILRMQYLNNLKKIDRTGS